MNSFWKTAAKVAWRESRASATKFIFVVFAVAVGVGSLTGVRGFSQALAAMLLREARTLMGGDVTVRSNQLPSREQFAVMDALTGRGVKITHVTETLSMVSSAKAGAPIAVSLKAVDPAVHPMYGAITLNPPGRIADVLDENTAVVSDDLRIRLKVGIGDAIQIGGAEFRIAAVLAAEPDRLSSGPVIGPRVMISREGLDRTGLIQLGSRAVQRYLMKSPSVPVADIRAELRKVFPDDSVVDYRDVNQNVTRSLDFATSFLSLVSMIALIVGGVGVATAMHSHLKQKMDSIAIMKSIGGRSSQIVRIYVLQTLMLGLAGGLAGVAIGSAVQHIFPPLIQRYFQVKAEVPWVPMSALQGILTGILTTLLFTLPPLFSIQKIRPAAIFRRDMPEAMPPWRERLMGSWPALASGALIIIGIGAIAMWLIGGPRDEAMRVGGYFVGGLLTSLILLAGVAWLLLRVLRTFIRVSPWKLPTSVRHGITNLYRPGSQSASILTALGVGVMFTLTVYLVQHSMLDEITKSAPPGMPNVFLLDITEQQRPGIAAMLASFRGRENAPELLGTVSAKLTAINGVGSEDYKVNGKKRPFAGRTILTSVPALPEGVTVLQGAWWKGTPPVPQISVDERLAKFMNLNVGADLAWTAFGSNFHTKVASIHRNDPHRLTSRIQFMVSPGPLDKLPTVYYGSVRIAPAEIPNLQRTSFEKFPTVTVINLADIIDRVQDVVTQVAMVIRLISAFAIVAGATILASSVAGTRFRRVREVVIFKTLGATRGKIATMFSAEFLILGTVAGFMGCLLATGFSALVMNRLMKLTYHFDPRPDLAAIVLTALIAAAAGWIASFRILGQKPLEVLRGE